MNPSPQSSLAQSSDPVGRVAGEPSMSTIRVFVSFDLEHDVELYELLLAQSRTASFGFTVVGASERSTAADISGDRVRRRIREADQVIVICGEHTENSANASAERSIAEQEGTPYFLLWGRREMMCTKPVGAKSAEGMFSWTQQILQEQIARVLRGARADASAENLRNATRTVRPSASDAVT
jgi:hypothetical protein